MDKPKLIEGIYSHYKNGDLYKTISVGHLYTSQNIYIVTYHKCDSEGKLIEIPNVFQPFCTDLNRWNEELTINGEATPRFKLIKQLK